MDRKQRHLLKCFILWGQLPGPVNNTPSQTHPAKICLTNLYAYVPWYIRIDGRVHKICREQMADEQQHSLDAFPLCQPQVTHSRHGRPVGPQKWHSTQDGSQSFRPGKNEPFSTEDLITLQPATATHTHTHRKEWRRCWCQRWCGWAKCRGRRSLPFSGRHQTLLFKAHRQTIIHMKWAVIHFCSHGAFYYLMASSTDWPMMLEEGPGWDRGVRLMTHLTGL